MCRLLAITKINKDELEPILKEFQKLAHTGNVLKGIKPGHKDGWGISAYKGNKNVFFEKKTKDAFNNKEYFNVIEKLTKIDLDLIIAHLRKASVGENKIVNTHPFLYKNYTFCHNGTISNSDIIPLKAKFKKLLKGNTDSERLFYFILQIFNETSKRFPQDIRNSIQKVLSFAHKNFDYKSLNFMFSNGEFLWVVRDISNKKCQFKQKDLKDYYTLYEGRVKNDGGIIISSEKLKNIKVEWESFNNYELREYNLKTNKKLVFHL